MKTAIYVEDGVVQLVITPENEFEKNAVSMFNGKDLDVKLFDGTFYDCRGGWVRQQSYYPNSQSFGGRKEDKSLILRVNESIEQVEPCSKS